MRSESYSYAKPQLRCFEINSGGRSRSGLREYLFICIYSPVPCRVLQSSCGSDRGRSRGLLCPEILRYFPLANLRRLDVNCQLQGRIFPYLASATNIQHLTIIECEDLLLEDLKLLSGAGKQSLLIQLCKAVCRFLSMAAVCNKTRVCFLQAGLTNS